MNSYNECLLGVWGVKSHETSQSCPGDAPGLKLLAASLSGSDQFSDLNFRPPTLAPARTPSLVLFPSEFGKHAHILILQ